MSILIKPLATLEILQRQYAKEQRVAEAMLEKARSGFVGRLVDHGVGRTRGKYEIIDVRLEYDFGIRARGRKVLAKGGLGHQSWDLGTITARRLGL